MSEKWTELNRAITAMAMAKGEAWKMRSFLAEHARGLRREADRIDEFLTKATEHTDLWYDALISEDRNGRPAHAPPVPSPLSTGGSVMDDTKDG